MFVDTKFNSLLTVFQNLYQVFSTTAIKLHHYLRAMEVRPQEKIIIGNDIIGEIDIRRHQGSHRTSIYSHTVPSQSVERKRMRCDRDAYSLVSSLDCYSNFEARCTGLPYGPVAKTDRLQGNDQMVEGYDERKSMWAITTERRKDCLEAQQQETNQILNGGRDYVEICTFVISHRL
jgi:hypothetical protein